jgi:H+/Cl- antiporter ClcA
MACTYLASTNSENDYHNKLNNIIPDSISNPIRSITSDLKSKLDQVPNSTQLTHVDQIPSNLVKASRNPLIPSILVGSITAAVILVIKHASMAVEKRLTLFNPVLFPLFGGTLLTILTSLFPTLSKPLFSTIHYDDEKIHNKRFSNQTLLLRYLTLVIAIGSGFSLGKDLLYLLIKSTISNHHFAFT